MTGHREELLAERLRREASKGAGPDGTRGGRAERARSVLRGALALSGLGGAGRRNALAVRLTRGALAIDGLPSALEGLRVLHVSDPHWREAPDPEHERGILDLVATAPHDVLVLTGDYRDRSFGPFDGALAALARLRGATVAPTLAVLGNHDSILMADPMRAAGVEVLVNGHALLGFADRPGATLAVAGVDDPAHYRLHDVGAATRGVPAGTPTLLLAHTPGIADAVARDHPEVRACLCGHTHGGQIVPPGARAALARERGVPVDTLAGAWSRPRAGGGTLSGYTVRGCGTSILDARFACPPEIRLHELTTGRAPSA